MRVLVILHVPEHGEELLHDPLLAPAAHHVVVGAEHGAQQHVGPARVVLAARLHVLPHLGTRALYLQWRFCCNKYYKNGKNGENQKCYC